MRGIIRTRRGGRSCHVKERKGETRGETKTDEPRNERRTSVCVELCASIHSKMGKVSRRARSSGAYLVGRPSSAGGGRKGWPEKRGKLAGRSRVRRLRSSGRALAPKLYCLVNDLSSSDSFWHRTPRRPSLCATLSLSFSLQSPSAASRLQTRRLLFKLNARRPAEGGFFAGPLGGKTGLSEGVTRLLGSRLSCETTADFLGIFSFFFFFLIVERMWSLNDESPR